MHARYIENAGHEIALAIHSGTRYLEIWKDTLFTSLLFVKPDVMHTQVRLNEACACKLRILLYV